MTSRQRNFQVGQKGKISAELKKVNPSKKKKQKKKEGGGKRYKCSLSMGVKSSRKNGGLVGFGLFGGKRGINISREKYGGPGASPNFQKSKGGNHRERRDSLVKESER